MKIAVISDIHDNLVNLAKCLNWCKQNNIESLICCGDIANGETLKIISEGFKNKIYLVKGNMEIYDNAELVNFDNIEYFGQAGRFELAGKKIGLCHESFRFEDVLKLGVCDIIFYGHTHKPWQETKNVVMFVNPGNVSNTFFRATFAVWDTVDNKLELKLLDEMI
jgi:uncharacterized protein